MLLAALLLVLAMAAPTAAGSGPPADGREEADEGSGTDGANVIYRAVEKRLSDLDENTRTVRVLVHYGRTEFFIENGAPKGVEYEALSLYEQYLNRSRGKHRPRIRLEFIPVCFDELLPGLLEGKGDIAAGLITVTEDRRREVAFSEPYVKDVAEVVVAHAGAVQPRTWDDLSGRKVHVLRGSSFADHLEDLNARLARSGLRPVEVVEMPHSANTDDILEMVNAGIFELTVADHFVAGLWANVLPDIRVIDGMALNRGGEIAWAVRPDNPELLKSLNGFVDSGRRHLKLRAAQLMKRYFKDTKLIRNPLGQEHFGRVKKLGPYFREAGDRHKIDWLMMVAQGYQESELNQRARSRRGAVGVMQLLPSTARGLGYRNITDARNNIAAGVAYMNFLRKTYFSDPEIPPAARVDFSLAAYNAGPNRIQALRQTAKTLGLNPNLWFDHVERVALDKVGNEPVRYVANVNRYYIAYKMSHQLDAQKKPLQGFRGKR